MAGAGKEKQMEEDMNLGEQRRDLAEEYQTRKILEILNTCESLEEAKEKVKEVGNKIKDFIFG